jgi:hypothetical protein
MFCWHVSNGLAFYFICVYMYCITNSTNKPHAICHRVMVLSNLQGQLQILPLRFKLLINYFIFSVPPYTSGFFFMLFSV